MKRMAVYLLTACLLWASSALSESLREQVGAPETIQAQYLSNTQKSLVAVDAKIIVPDVDAIPLLAVSARDFSAADAWTLASVAAPDGQWRRSYDQPNGANLLDHSQSPADFDGKLDLMENQEMNYYNSSINLLSDAEQGSHIVRASNSYRKTAFGDQPDWHCMEYELYTGYNTPHFYQSIVDIAPDSVGQDIKGQPTSYQEAAELAQTFVTQVAPGFELRIGGAVKGEVTYHKEGTDKYRSAYWKTPAYLFCFTRTLGNVPVTMADYAQYASKREENNVAPAPGNEYVTVAVHDNRVVRMCWYDPYQVGDMLASSCELLPFSQIMDVFGAIAPLSIQSMENENAVMGGTGNKLEINEIRLGYMPVLQKDNPHQWELRPVWDFIGVRSFARERYDWPCQSALTIDAIDGTVIDRNYGY